MRSILKCMVEDFSPHMENDGYDDGAIGNEGNRSPMCSQIGESSLNSFDNIWMFGLTKYINSSTDICSVDTPVFLDDHLCCGLGYSQSSCPSFGGQSLSSVACHCFDQSRN